MNKKSIFLNLTICFIILLLVAVSYSSKIVNPFIGLKGVIKLNLSDNKVEKISDDPLRYISRNSESFIDYIESKGYTVEQMGRGFDLRKDNENKLLMLEGFLYKYEIFSEYKSGT